jgi:Holliday junction DNA helicase RuvB
LSRFGIKSRLEYYDALTLKNILLRSAKILGTTISEAAANEIAGRSRTPPELPTDF